MCAQTEFQLEKKFVDTYRNVKPDFGFHPLGEITYLRTYSRLKQDGTKEQWVDTIERVVNGCYSMQKAWVVKMQLGWDEKKAHRSAQEMFERMFTMKFLPPGRGLWAMGSPIVTERGIYAALNNCGFVSTKNIDLEGADPFTFVMEALMLGIGMGGDTGGAGKCMVYHPSSDEPETVVIDDSREDWAQSTHRLINSFLGPNEKCVLFDYSRIRPRGTPMKGFGGTASGPEPLRDMHEAIRHVLAQNAGSLITERTITDLFNLIGVCVQAGNVRRSAEIMFGSPYSDVFLNLKNYALNPERESYGWTSNNTVMADIGMNYSKIASCIERNGEPGVAWLHNMRQYSRMRADEKDNKDHRVMGSNPCVSIDTMVLTTEGQKRVHELILRPFEAIVDGKAYPSTLQGFWKTGRNKSLYQITLENGSSLKVTKSHKIMMSDGSMRECCDIKVGEHVRLNITDIMRLSDFEDKRWISRVISIKNVGREDVYDCTILEKHLFSANGVLVSNCSEQSLESYELCCLVETFPFRCSSLQDFTRTLKFAYMYAKTVTLGQTHWPRTNRVLLRNRRIGCSMSGITQFIAKHGIQELKQWCKTGYKTIQRYDNIYSDWFCVPRSIKTTSIKPSGTVSLLAGATSGMHYPEAEYYIRRIRLGTDSPLVGQLQKAGYHVEPDVVSRNTMVAEIPLCVSLQENGSSSKRVRTVAEVSMWEQLSLAAFLQKYWADNQVSCTVTFDPTEARYICSALQYFQYHLKSISFLPLTDHSEVAQRSVKFISDSINAMKGDEDAKGVLNGIVEHIGAKMMEIAQTPPYPQMPNQKIDKQRYEELVSKVKLVNFYDTQESVAEKYCDGDKCVL